MSVWSPYNRAQIVFLLTLSLLLLNLLRVAVEEHVGHDVPLLVARDAALEAEHLTAEEPPEETNRVLGLVVARDGNVDVAKGRVSIAECNDGDVDVRSLPDSLVVDARVGDDNDARLLEGADDVVGKGTGGETASDGSCARVGGELEHGPVTVLPTGNDANVRRVLDGSENTGSKDDLLPSLAEVDEVDPVSAALVDVRKHCLLDILGADVRLGGEEEVEVLLGRVENRWELSGSHFD